MASTKKVKFQSLELVCNLVRLHSETFSARVSPLHIIFIENQANLICHQRSSQAPLTPQLTKVGHPLMKCQKFTWSLAAPTSIQMQQVREIPTRSCTQTPASYKQFPRLRTGPHRKGVKVHRRYLWEKRGSKISPLFLFIIGIITTGCSGFVPQWMCLWTTHYWEIPSLSSFLDWFIH